MLFGMLYFWMLGGSRYTRFSDSDLPVGINSRVLFDTHVYLVSIYWFAKENMILFGKSIKDWTINMVLGKSDEETKGWREKIKMKRGWRTYARLDEELGIKEQ